MQVIVDRDTSPPPPPPQLNKLAKSHENASTIEILDGFKH